MFGKSKTYYSKIINFYVSYKKHVVCTLKTRLQRITGICFTIIRQRKPFYIEGKQYFEKHTVYPFL